jgi:metallo-beta-lactamase class B
MITSSPRRRALLIVLAIGHLLPGAAARAQDARTRAAWNEPMAPFRVIGNVYYVGVAGVSSFLITTKEGHVLLDGGFEESAPRIAASIEALGFHLKDVRLLINSHAHLDHAGGLAELKRRSGARLIASRGDAALLAAGRQMDFSGRPDSQFPRVAVDRVVEDGQRVELGDAQLTAHLTPGHTPGCTTWTYPVTEGGRTYQVLFHCSTTAPGYRLVDNPRYPRIAEDYARAFATLEGLPCDVLLAPHGELFGLADKRARLGAGANPFVDPSGCRNVLEASRAAFNRELARQRAR